MSEGDVSTGACEVLTIDGEIYVRRIDLIDAFSVWLGFKWSAKELEVVNWIVQVLTAMGERVMEGHAITGEVSNADDVVRFYADQNGTYFLVDDLVKFVNSMKKDIGFGEPAFVFINAMFDKLKEAGRV